jgi:hypothetical protein
MKYLIIQCEPLNDPYECDADRTPVCMTDDPTQYGYGYEIWEVQEDGTFVRIKEYDTANESGMALYFWRDDAEDGDAPEVLVKFPGMTRWEVTAEVLANVIRMANFTEADAKEILDEIHCTGGYGEQGDECWMVFGGYEDDRFDCGY